jgi:hypothetical protein
MKEQVGSVKNSKVKASMLNQSTSEELQETTDHYLEEASKAQSENLMLVEEASPGKNNVGFNVKSSRNLGKNYVPILAERAGREKKDLPKPNDQRMSVYSVSQGVKFE